MGEVYLAEEALLGRKVAIKVLNPILTREEHFKQRFVNEAKIQASLQHPNIVALYSFFEQDENYYMALEYAEGITLKDLIAQTGPIPEPRVKKILLQILNALQYAHAKGIIHRDIKPSNIMVDGNDSIKIMDFGIARIMGDSHLTKTGLKVGTLFYMSPEQIVTPKEVDYKTDIYSTGIVLYEMLTGQLPFNTDTESDFVIQKEIVDNNLPDPKSFYPHISDNLIKLVYRMTAKDINKRPDFQKIISDLATSSDRNNDKTILEHEFEEPWQYANLRDPVSKDKESADSSNNEPWQDAYLLPKSDNIKTKVDEHTVYKALHSNQPPKKSHAGWVVLSVFGFIILIIASIAIEQNGGFGCRAKPQEIPADTTMVVPIIEVKESHNDTLQFTYKTINEVQQMSDGREFKVIFKYPLFYTDNQQSKKISMAFSKIIQSQLESYEGSLPPYGQDFRGLSKYLLAKWVKDDEEGYCMGYEENINIEILLNSYITTICITHYWFGGGAHGMKTYNYVMFDREGNQIPYTNLIQQSNITAFNQLLIDNFDSQYSNPWNHQNDYKTSPIQYALVRSGLLVMFEMGCTAEGFPQILIPAKDILTLLNEPYHSQYKLYLE